ncbi:MAG: hypothetical protein K0Q46_3695 [Rhodococcus erythropolis]|jgi:apolipoprotein N-acyltransferase|nr:nitrilase-related carbon-nitrogen hydrolase [Rhodococcus erythropolis]MDF2896909.1 hypothetical protein [Rhodococcus erythropolis]
MSAQAVDQVSGSAPHETNHPDLSGRASTYLLLLFGAVAALFAVGGRWDIPAAAWIAPVLLLRFSRVSTRRVGLPAVWLVSVAAPLFWMQQMMDTSIAPTKWTSVVGLVAAGTVLFIPYLVDRLLTERLGALGRMMLFPLAWASAQYLVAVVSPFGTAYGLSAVSQRTYLGFLQVISVFGPFVIAFLIGWLATAVNAQWESGWTRLHGREKYGALAAVLVVVGSVFLGGVRMAFFTTVSTPTVTIAGISPSPEARTWISGPPADRDAARPEFTAAQDDLLAETRRAAGAGAKVVFWSENAAPVLDEDYEALLDRAAVVAREEGIYLMVADRVYTPEGPGRDETHLIDPEGAVRWSYEKMKPIPGLEDYKPGPGPVPVVDTPYGRIASVICYDADFPAIMHVDTDIMLIPGGEWPSIARTHTAMSSLRGVENGYSVIRASFYGESGAFDYQGRMIAAKDTTGQGLHTLYADLPTRGVATIYRQVGDIFAWLSLAATIGLIGLGWLRPRADR